MSGNCNDIPPKEELDAFLKSKGLDECGNPLPTKYVNPYPSEYRNGIKKAGKQSRRERRAKEKRVKIYYKNPK